MSGADFYSDGAVEYYDPTYAALRGNIGDIGFYRALAVRCGAPVLELGCGTGRVLLPIASDGLACTGIDRSEPMLAALRRKAAAAGIPGVRAVCAPMQSFDLPGDRFALVFAAFRGFQHLLTVEDQLACLERVRRHLATGAAFAFDVFAPRFERLDVLEEPEMEDARFRDAAGAEVVRYASIRRDPARQLIHVDFRFAPAGGTPAATPAARFSTTLRYFFRYELEHLLARAGFDRVELYGGFDGRPWDSVSGETVVVARAAFG